MLFSSSLNKSIPLTQILIHNLIHFLHVELPSHSFPNSVNTILNCSIENFPWDIRMKETLSIPCRTKSLISTSSRLPLMSRLRLEEKLKHRNINIQLNHSNFLFKELYGKYILYIDIDIKMHLKFNSFVGG